MMQESALPWSPTPQPNRALDEAQSVHTNILLVNRDDAVPDAGR